MTRRYIVIIILISFCLYVFLGMMDYETKSLIHLFTAEFGNVVALLLYTLVFSIIGMIILKVICLVGPISCVPAQSEDEIV